MPADRENFEPAETGDSGPPPLLRPMRLTERMSEKQLLVALIRQQEMATELIANMLLAFQPEETIEVAVEPDTFTSDYNDEEDWHPMVEKVTRMCESLEHGIGFHPPTMAQVDTVLRAYDAERDRQAKSRRNHPSNAFRNRTD